MKMASAPNQKDLGLNPVVIEVQGRSHLSKEPCKFDEYWVWFFKKMHNMWFDFWGEIFVDE